ncbi:TetR/AcrR family transcriptional regulator [Pseudomonas gingeri]|uniref:TetR/AcrR family transcriptional regulator n=1 Tax=Pseudomonas gingeri TaxID=117681 RepID=A0A7Y8C325_9PSED|nr:TetR/AcrR family transcriptional regulator [Pseudomonas gingeri]NWD78590.1 TetR/AcrR family transcriptional regulator [Pseudomonas gingeri]
MELMNPVQRRIHQAALRLFAKHGAIDVSIRDLANEAGVARGTIYNNNVQDMDQLFETVAARLSAEMHERVKKSFESITDPAHRLSNGVRFFIRRAHEEPQWGTFIHRFAINNAALREMFASQATKDLLDGLAIGRYAFRQDQLISLITLISGAALGSMFLVLEGHRTWREAGTDTAEFILRALGVPAQEARELAAQELPELSTID